MDNPGTDNIMTDNIMTGPGSDVQKFSATLAQCTSASHCSPAAAPAGSSK